MAKYLTMTTNRTVYDDIIHEPMAGVSFIACPLSTMAVGNWTLGKSTGESQGQLLLMSPNPNSQPELKLLLHTCNGQSSLTDENNQTPIQKMESRKKPSKTPQCSNGTSGIITARFPSLPIASHEMQNQLRALNIYGCFIRK